MNNTLQISSTLSLLEKITQEIILIFHFLQLLYNLKGFFFYQGQKYKSKWNKKAVFFLSKLKKDSCYWYNLLIYFKELWKFVFWILYLTSSVNIFFNICNYIQSNFKRNTKFALGRLLKGDVLWPHYIYHHSLT